jgi:hypothetical protein
VYLKAILKQGQCKAWHIPSPKNLTLTFDLENKSGSRFSYGLSMYQVISSENKIYCQNLKNVIIQKK